MRWTICTWKESGRHWLPILAMINVTTLNLLLIRMRICLCICLRTVYDFSPTLCTHISSQFRGQGTFAFCVFVYLSKFELRSVAWHMAYKLRSNKTKTKWRVVFYISLCHRPSISIPPGIIKIQPELINVLFIIRIRGMWNCNFWPTRISSIESWIGNSGKHWMCQIFSKQISWMLPQKYKYSPNFC